MRLVREHPEAYLQKVVWNLRRSAFGGVIVQMPTREGPVGRTRSERLRAVASLRLSGFSWAFWTIVDKSRIYRLSFLLLCGLSLFLGGRGFTHAAACWRPENVAISRFCVVYTIVEFALVSLGHYEVRFVSPLYWVQVLTLVQLLSTETCTSPFGRSVSTVWQRLRGEASPPAAT